MVRNDIWSVDFVADQLIDGRRFRALTVIDLFTRECLAIDIGRGLAATRWRPRSSACDSSAACRTGSIAITGYLRSQGDRAPLI
jgi:transposase InsO family protein